MTDGMDALRARMERRSRVVPPSRQKAPSSTPVSGPPAPSGEESGFAQGHEPGGENNAPGTESRLEVLPSPGPASASAPSDPAPGPGMPPSPETTSVAAQSAPAATLPSLAPVQWGIPASDEPLSNLNVRVRASLNERVDDLVYELRKQGLRTSKAELVEALLAALPPHPTPELTDRLTTFRRLSPRLG